MARIDIRLSPEEKASLVDQARQASVSLSELVRRRLFGTPEPDDRVEALERRLARLEEMAGL